MGNLSDDETGVPLVEDISGSEGEQRTSSSKRKRDADEKSSAKRRKVKKPKDVDDDALDADLGVNHAIAHMDSRLLADHVAQRTKRFKPDLSIVEREDWHVPGETGYFNVSPDLLKLMQAQRTRLLIPQAGRILERRSIFRHLSNTSTSPTASRKGRGSLTLRARKAIHIPSL